ncbi:MAG: hypothetical protein IPK04_03090 [Bdellovibrionales bacterium]|jgi:hypothetical protein|nr:hypothetical protein [Bdellovibrionales bacterium]
MINRKSTRFQPDPMTIAQLDFATGKDFRPTLIGLVINESYTGCAIVLVADEAPKKDLKLKIKVGALSPLKAQIAWIKNLEENIYKVGIRLLE